MGQNLRAEISVKNYCHIKIVVCALMKHINNDSQINVPLSTSIDPCSGVMNAPQRLISHSAKKEGIGAIEVLDRVTMQVFIRDNCTVIAAPVQCDVDGIPKGSHYVRVPIVFVTGSRRLPCLYAVIADDIAVDLVFIRPRRRERQSKW